MIVNFFRCSFANQIYLHHNPVEINERVFLLLSSFIYDVRKYLINGWIFGMKSYRIVHRACVYTNSSDLSFLTMRRNECSVPYFLLSLLFEEICHICTSCVFLFIHSDPLLTSTHVSYEISHNWMSRRMCRSVSNNRCCGCIIVNFLWKEKCYREWKYEILNSFVLLQSMNCLSIKNQHRTAMVSVVSISFWKRRNSTWVFYWIIMSVEQREDTRWVETRTNPIK